MDEDEKHISTTKARAGTTPHMTRYILSISLAILVLLILLLFIFRA